MLQFARWITERDYRAALMAAGLVLLPLLAPVSCAVLALVALQRAPAPPGAAGRSQWHCWRWSPGLPGRTRRRSVVRAD
jgi:hypothetical protein